MHIKMKFEPVRTQDISHLKELQPAGWPDIIPQFQYYIKSPFCFPFKYLLGNQMAGIGTYILFEKTAWLAHIIVSMDQRKKGIGLQIVELLLDKVQKHSIQTVLLIATELGQSVYSKAGFRTVSDYTFLERKKPWNSIPHSENIILLKERFVADLLAMDKKVTGENRQRLLINHLENACLCIEGDQLSGFYLPDLREGPIIALSEKAGLDLMKFKYAKTDIASLPSENKSGIHFLKENGFAEVNKTGKRMILGKDIDCYPQNIYSRIGGNFG